MKQIFTFLVLLLSTAMFAQADAPDFTVTDLDGNEHNLYTILEEGKVVVIDVSATWCPPCWSFHEGHFLKDIHEKYGPDGTDQVRVLFYEGDVSTGQAELEGTGNTQGDWLTGTTYPVVDESPLTLNSQVWWPLGFPTISVVRPGDKKIIADLYDPWVAGGGLAAMEEIIEGAFPTTSSAKDLEEINVSVYPNPFVAEVTIDLTNAEFDFNSIQLLDITGAMLQDVDVTGQKIIKLNTTQLNSGLYVVNVLENGVIVGSTIITK